LNIVTYFHLCVENKIAFKILECRCPSQNGYKDEWLHDCIITSVISEKCRFLISTSHVAFPNLDPFPSLETSVIAGIKS
jgi:hypothetical protein